MWHRSEVAIVMGWYGWDGGMSWLGWLGMGLMMLLFWVLLAVVVVWVVRSTGAARAADSRAAEPDPLRILDERLARGEVTEEEYQRRRDLLRGR